MKWYYISGLFYTANCSDAWNLISGSQMMVIRIPQTVFLWFNEWVPVWRDCSLMFYMYHYQSLWPSLTPTWISLSINTLLTKAGRGPRCRRPDTASISVHFFLFLTLILLLLLQHKHHRPHLCCCCRHYLHHQVIHVRWLQMVTSIHFVCGQWGVGNGQGWQLKIRAIET